MIERLAYLWPEAALFVATCIVMVLGLSPKLSVRKLSAFVAFAGILAAGLLALLTTPASTQVTAAAGQTLLPNLAMYAKVVICVVALPLVLLLAGTVDREEELAIQAGRIKFNPLRSNRAEFYSFVLFSLTGLLLCASADDLIWLFLALELTSLPTYIMVTISGSAGRGEHKSREAGVKYFFLGALGAAVFLYGFALLYGATGSTNLNQIYAVFTGGGFNTMALAGMMLAILGLCFKIAAVPMHFYTADVYQGAASGVSAFLAFVPKTAGFIAILLLVSTMGDVNGATRAWLPESIRLMLWVIAALTMTVGNILAVLQSNIKRVLAYSSIAHSGYMLVGVIAGPGDGPLAHNGLGAVLFYLLVYGTMNVGVFAVLGSLEKGKAGGEIQHVETFEDLRGLYSKHPWLTAVMVVSGLGLLGFPPLLGFFGKVPLFTSLAAAGEYPLLIVLAINSAIAAYYYLRLVAVPFLESPDSRAEQLRPSPFRSRGFAGFVSAVAVIGLTLVADQILFQSNYAANYRGKMIQHVAQPASEGGTIRDLLTPRSDASHKAGAGRVSVR